MNADFHDAASLPLPYRISFPISEYQYIFLYNDTAGMEGQAGMMGFLCRPKIWAKTPNSPVFVDSVDRHSTKK
jgi:hypothetical protein